jgi:hypothetical protein
MKAELSVTICEKHDGCILRFLARSAGVEHVIQPMMFFLGLVVLAAQNLLAFAGDVTVVSTFPANKGPGWKDSIDVSGAKRVLQFLSFAAAR